MNLLMLILIFLGLLAAGTVFYVAWRLSSDLAPKSGNPGAKNEEPGDAKE
jgi:flagellar basal body-associated protein FliL